VSEDKAVLIKTAYSYYQKGDWDRAIEEYHKLADLDPKDLNVHNMLADIYAKKGDVQEALQQYDLVAQGFDQKNQVDKVLQVYKRMLKLVPNDPDLLNAVKNLIDKYLTRAGQLEDEDPGKSAEIYRFVLKTEPNRIDAHFKLARLLAKNGQKFEAVESLMNLLTTLDPETQTGRLVEVLEVITELDPLNIEAREKMITLFIQAKQTPAAVKGLQDLIEIYISRNEFYQAQEAAQKAIELGDSNTYYHLGVIYFNQQKYAEGRQAFEKFLTTQEGHVGALKYLALSLLRLGQTAEAVQVYLKILDVYFNENLLDEAREVKQTILELDPTNGAVNRYPVEQSVLLSGTESTEYPPTVSVSEEERSLEDQQALLTQAAGFTERGFYEQAIDIYLDMLKRWPQLPEIRVRLQQVYALMARAAEPVEKYPSPEEIKRELERELREQMRRELDEQARIVQEQQKELEQKRELEQLRLKQELESKLMEQVNRTKEEELRQQISREYEEKQSQLAAERERIEREKEESLNRLKEELEKSKVSLEQKLREQIEKETKERVDREIQLKTALEQEEEKRKREEEDRKKYVDQKKEQEAAKAKINQEILQGMERLRLEKEKEAKTASAPPISSPKPLVEMVSANTPPESQESLDDPFVRQTLAEIYAKQGLYVEALKIYEKILNEEPNNEDVREKLRDILRLKGM
jgi:tetratricopeptide (TPR) repeat protein